jgi:hypothetical protein
MADELAQRPPQEGQQADDNAVMEIASASLESPIQNIAILSLIVLVQVSWLLTLGYAVIRLTH